MRLEKDSSVLVESTMKRQYVLGRKEKKLEGSLNIGRYYALDSSLGAEVHVDVLHPHIVLICGKRGYGKSYTMGVFIEEISNLEKEIRDNLGVIVVDTLGIFWTMRFPNTNNVEKINKLDHKSKGIDINVLVSKRHVEEYRERGINAHGFSIRTSELSPFHWCQLFDVKSTDTLGIVLTRAVLKMQAKSNQFSIHDLLKCIKNDERSDDNVKGAAENFLTIAESWGVFDRDGMSVEDFVTRGTITILDISHLHDPNLKVIVASIVGEKIFEGRIRERKIHELKKMGYDVKEKGIPMVWMAIDEAQLFLPDDKDILSKDVFINEWMRQGRQPGLSLIMATQRPSALDQEVMSHCDLIICHRLTSQNDISALSKIRPTYMHGDIKESIKKVGDEKGVAFIIDDTSESSHIIKVRHRCSWHGGDESLAMEPKSK